MPARLIAYLQYNPNVGIEIEEDEKTTSSLDKIIILLREHSGNDFSLYKKTTLIRRIERRKAIHQISKVSNYVRFLQENPKEIEILFKELLIGVTSFFRDAAVWDMLKHTFLPELLKELPDHYMLRAWVPACSTGEEVYSWAIIFNEILEESGNPKKQTLQIFGTDLDNEAIEKARRGIFHKDIAADLSSERINKYFTEEIEGYKIKNFIRETVVFAVQNVIKDPPFTNIDILSCRNMLIYMEPELQNKLLALFNYSLKPGGIMVLGTAETLGKQHDKFIELNSKLRIFKQPSTVKKTDYIFPKPSVHQKALKNENKAIEKTNDNIQTLTDQILLQRFAPASVLVNERGDIIYITGRTGKYLEPVAGKANWNIYAMAREGLRNVLPDAFRRTKNNYEAVVLHNIKVGTNGGTQFVDVTIERIEHPLMLKDMIILVFADVPALVEHKVPKTGKLGYFRPPERIGN